MRRSAAPDNALILSSATPGKVADDSDAANSVLVTELLGHINANVDTKTAAGAETLFNKTRVAISRASDGEQVPVGVVLAAAKTSRWPPPRRGAEAHRLTPRTVIPGRA